MHPNLLLAFLFFFLPLLPFLFALFPDQFGDFINNAELLMISVEASLCRCIEVTIVTIPIKSLCFATAFPIFLWLVPQFFVSAAFWILLCTARDGIVNIYNNYLHCILLLRILHVMHNILPSRIYGFHNASLFLINFECKSAAQYKGTYGCRVLFELS